MIFHHKRAACELAEVDEYVSSLGGGQHQAFHWHGNIS
jgi:hypothetical protein